MAQIDHVVVLMLENPVNARDARILEDNVRPNVATEYVDLVLVQRDDSVVMPRAMNSQRSGRWRGRASREVP